MWIDVSPSPTISEKLKSGLTKINRIDPIYRNPAKHFDNINFDSLYLKNYSINLLCFCLEKNEEFFNIVLKTK